MTRPRQGPRTTRGELTALVLQCAASRDDVIARLLTDAGEVTSVLAPRARLARGREGLAATLQPLSAVCLTVVAREDLTRDAEMTLLPRVESGRLLEGFGRLKADPEKLAAASCMAEAVMHLVPEGACEPSLPQLLARALARLDAAPPEVTVDLLALFLLRLLDASGLLPPLGAGSDAEGQRLPEAARGCLEGWREGRWAPLPPREVRLTLDWLERLVATVSQRPLRSRAVLDALRGEG
jgi:recombinational DNA repair protein (RecF pathway)